MILVTLKANNVRHGEFTVFNQEKQVTSCITSCIMHDECGSRQVMAIDRAVLKSMLIPIQEARRTVCTLRYNIP